MRTTRRVCGLVQGCAFFTALLALVTLAPAQETKPAKPEEKPVAAKPEAPKPSTLDNLQAAYDGERNAHERYVAFAKKAEEEGYGQVASLFRAAARSEEIHASDLADVIKKMGGTPKADVKKPEAKATKDNLMMAVIGESLERDTMYPAFVKQAKADGNKDAAEVFNYALQSETGHAALYKEALDNIDQWKAGKKDFFVCSVCGNTVVKVDFEKCPVCLSPKSKFEKIN
jgi:rubrerythrin